METIQISMTEREVEALMSIVGLAVDDQDHYLDAGDVAADHGKEWPTVATGKAAMFRDVAAVATRLNRGGTAPSCSAIADEMANAAGGPKADLLKQYREMHDRLSEMIEGGFLKREQNPTDYDYLVEALAELGAHPANN